ncbi:MAG: hypothetical protein HN993_10730 [Lentimicrobiaceae bacterium]|nr:hypothetical protein [Lentimicrobiaceae bacterium]
MKSHLLTLVFLASFLSLMSQDLPAEEKKLSFNASGFINLNAILDFNGLEDYDDFTTSQIPINPSPYQNMFRFHMTARQSRLNFGINYNTPWGKLKGFVSGDFYSGNEGIISRFRLREAYFEIGNLLLGQTNTTMGNPDVVPTTVDFQGPNSATTLRNPMIRYSSKIGKGWSYILAIEMRGGDISPFKKTGKPFTFIPTLVGNINKEGDWGVVTLSAMSDITSYFYADSVTGSGIVKKAKVGYGGAVSAIINTWKKDHFSIFYIAGKGVANFISDLSGLGYNGMPDYATKELMLLSSMGGFIAYTHYWDDKFSSNIIYSYVNLEKTDLLADTAFKSSNYALINLFYSPFERLNFGVEYIWGELFVQDNENGTANCLQFLAQFKF